MRHYTSLKIFVASLRALGKVMTSPPLVASKHTCYKLIMSLSTQARTLQKIKYEVHTKLPQIAYQIQIWYAICGKLV